VGFFAKLFGQGDSSPGLPDMEFIDIKPGTFIMGTEKRFYNHVVPRAEKAKCKINGTEVPDLFGDELPRQVTISKSFSLGKYHVTQGQWEVVMGDNPVEPKFRGQSKPLVIFDAARLIHLTDEFLSRLNAAQSAYDYRLPTEAEWEYACRAGTTSLWHFDDEKKVLLDPKAEFKPIIGSRDGDLELAFYAEYVKYGVASVPTGEQGSKGSTKPSLSPVGSKKPNPWGLYDMYGNAWELVQDFYAPYPAGPVTNPCCAKGTDRIFRGGSFAGNPMFSRSAVRRPASAMSSISPLGLRLVRTPGQSTSK